MRWRRGALRFLVVALALAGAASRLEGQGNRRTVLTISGFPLSVGSTTIAQFDAGAIAIGTTSFSVDLTTNAGAGGFSPRVTTVNVACNVPCPVSGTAPVSGLEWQRGGTSTWTPLSTTFAFVESRTATFNGTNDPWSNTITWRFAPTFATTNPGTTQFRIDFQLVVTAP